MHGVYPRVCGGTILAPRRNFFNGLSPRVRGNLVVYRKFSWRSIPACAGEPPAPPTPRNRPRVYPRVCGGTPHDSVRLSITCGLSPRVRGNHRCSPLANNGLRSIPACAGEPKLSRQEKIIEKVYPRVCGGTVMPPILALEAMGLSPRVRGNPGDVGLVTGRKPIGLSPRVRGNPTRRK